MSMRMTMLVIVAMTLAGCQYSADTATRTIAYNKAIAQSTNDLFLLNAVRASRREPTYYTRNQTDTTTASVAPTLSVTTPLSGAPMTATQITSNPTSSMMATTGASAAMSTTMGTSQTIGMTRTIMRAAATLNPSLAFTESNQLTLQNLDDQQSVNGILTPITLNQIQNYLNEGYNTSELFILTIDSITVPRKFLKYLPTAAAAHCGSRVYPINPTKQLYGPGEIPPDGLYCRYLFEHHTLVAYPPFSPEKGQPPQNIAIYTLPSNSPYPNNINPRCFAIDTSDAITPRSPTDLGGEKPPEGKDHDLNVTLYNDPAIKDAAPTIVNGSIKDYSCFKQVLITLLALDLNISNNDSIKALYNLPVEYIERNPRYLTDVSAQGLNFAYDKQDSRRFGVCKKSSDLQTSITTSDPYLRLIYRSLGYNSGHVHDRPESRYVALGSTDQQPKDCASAVALASPTHVTLETSDDDTPTIAYTPRSLEAMVYFLGQIVRRMELYGEDSLNDVSFPNTRPGDNDLYPEAILKVKKGLVPLDAAVASASFGPEFYWIPKLCKNTSDPKCSLEYPDHAGPQVLTILNQLWGLNKTQTSAPIIPTVTVVAH